jgi:tetratricopeptide (TPR) repeat protein
LQPGWDEALNNLGYSYFLLGQTDKAIETYQEALQANPKHPRVLFNLTTAYARENKMDLAKATCETLSKVDPEHAAALRQNNFQATSAPAPASAPAVSVSPSP